MTQFTHTMILGKKSIGMPNLAVLTVVENERLPEAVEILFNFFRENFEKCLAQETLYTSNPKDVENHRAARESYRKAVEDGNWLEAVMAATSVDTRDYHFRFVPVKFNPDEQEVLEAVVRRGWSTKHFHYPEGDDKDAVVKAIEDERWEDALQGISRHKSPF